MSEFTAVLCLPVPPASAAELPRGLHLPGVALPAGEGSALVLRWEDWPALIARAPQVWEYIYAPDGESLVVRGHREGRCWLNLDFSALGVDVLGLEDMLDERGLFPDGSPGPAVALERSRASVEEARDAGELFPEVAAWLLSVLDGQEDPGTLADTLPARLGFGTPRWVNPDDLEVRAPEEWRSDFPGAQVVS